MKFLVLMCTQNCSFCIRQYNFSLFGMRFLSAKAAEEAIDRVVEASCTGEYSLQEAEIIRRYCGAFPLDRMRTETTIETIRGLPALQPGGDVYYGHVESYIYRQKYNAKSAVFNQLMEIDQKFDIFRNQDAIQLIFECYCIELYDEPFLKVIHLISCCGSLTFKFSEV